MELWIRSQNKAFLEQVNGLLVFEKDTGECEICKGFTTYGTYKTKERALEVLDEIQKKINLINLGHDFGSPMVDLENPTYTYEMPKE